MQALLRSTLKKLAYLAASLLIFAALLIGITRLISPLLSNYRPEIEAWATQVLETPVNIRAVHVSWFRYQPGISLDNVTLLDKNSKEPILQIKEIRVFFSIPRSLWEFKPVPSGVLLSGSAVNLHEGENGQIVMQGFPAIGGFNDQPYKSETKFIDMLGWLSLQPRLVLRDIDIRYQGLNGNKRYVTLYDLSFINSSHKHSILGKAILHQQLPTEVNVAIQWLGQATDLQHIQARAYLYVSGLSLSQWFKGVNWQGWEITDGAGSAKVWLNWNNNAIQKVQTTFEMYDLTFLASKDKSLHKITRMSGDIGWRRDANSNHLIAGNDILIDLPGHLWPTTNFYLMLSPTEKGLALKKVNVGYVNLADVQSIVLSSNFLNADALQLLKDLKVKGEVQNASVNFAGNIDDFATTSIDAKLNRVSFSQLDKFPAIQNISGELTWDGRKGNFAISSNQLIFDYPSVFINPIVMDQVSGTINLSQSDKKEWLLQTPQLQLMNNDLAANISGSFNIQPNVAPIANIKANFTMQHANQIDHYLPIKIFSPKLRNWLQHAFLAGEVKSGEAILNGPLNDFPFDNNVNGIFKISGTVNNVKLQFDPDWPIVDKIDAQLDFSGRHMSVNASHAEIASVPVTNVQAYITGLGGDEPTLLTIQSDNVNTDFTKALAFIHASPLDKTIGKAFAAMSVLGNLSLKLNLSIPLDNTEDTKVEGLINVQNALVNLVPWRLAVANVNGDVNFTEKTVQSNNLQGLLFNKPVQVQLSTIEKDKNTVTRIGFVSNLYLSDLEAWLKVPFSKVVQGAANVKANVYVGFNSPTQIHLTSDLQGVAVDLPGEYGKKAIDKSDFSADIIAADAQPLRISLNYEKLLSAALILNPKDETYILNAANIRFGKEVAAWPASAGLYISGNLDLLDWNKLKSYSEGSDNDSMPSLPLKNVDITVDTIDLGSHVIKNARLGLQPNENNWDVNIESEDIAGQLQIPKKVTRQSVIKGDFSKLHLRSIAKPTVANEMPSVDVKSLPALELSANDVVYDDMPIGRVTLIAKPNAAGLSIDTLEVNSPRVFLQADGSWLPSGTLLKGKVESDKVSDLIGSLGFDVHNFEAKKGNLTFNLNWNGTPYAPNVSTLSGSARLNLGEGRIINVGQTSGAKMDLGRLLSIFSLQTIPRRLSLDFSDVFEKGYSFDSVKGDFTFKNGNAFISNMRFEGPVAKVAVDGRVGLTAKDLNLVLSVYAHVTSSLPVAATLLTGQPLIGLAALAFNTVMSSQVSKVASYYYAVTGTWDDPSWKQISSQKNQ